MTSARSGCAVVTGASRGIGASIAQGLARDGWPVGVNYRAEADAARMVVDSIRSEGGQAVAIEADVRDPDAPERLLGTARREFGRPALVVVNNAGIVRDALVPQLDDDAWDAVLETNLTAAFRLTRQALREMMRERFGRIVNVAAVAGQRANPGQAAYAASKAGLVAFTKTAAVEVARLSITINAVAPGLIETDATQDVMGKILGQVPAKRSGRPDEVADCVRFLVSEQASYINGSLFTVDGGLSA